MFLKILAKISGGLIIFVICVTVSLNDTEKVIHLFYYFLFATLVIIVLAIVRIIAKERIRLNTPLNIIRIRNRYGNNIGYKGGSF